MEEYDAIPYSGLDPEIAQQLRESTAAIDPDTDRGASLGRTICAALLGHEFDATALARDIGYFDEHPSYMGRYGVTQEALDAVHEQLGQNQ